MLGRLLHEAGKHVQREGVQAQLGLVQHDQARQVLLGLEQQGGHGHEAEGSIGELMGAELVLRGVPPPGQHHLPAGVGRQVKIAEEGGDLPHGRHNPIVVGSALLPEAKEEGRQVLAPGAQRAALAGVALQADPSLRRGVVEVEGPAVGQETVGFRERPLAVPELSPLQFLEEMGLAPAQEGAVLES